MKSILVVMAMSVLLVACSDDGDTSPENDSFGSAFDVGRSNAKLAWDHAASSGLDVKKKGPAELWRLLNLETEGTKALPGIGEDAETDEKILGEAQRGMASFWLEVVPPGENSPYSNFVHGYQEGYARGKSKGLIPFDVDGIGNAADKWAKNLGFSQSATVSASTGFSIGMYSWARGPRLPNPNPGRYDVLGALTVFKRSLGSLRNR